MTDAAREVGRKIASYRLRRGLSQREFAPLIGRSEAWLSQVERGIREVKGIDVLEKISQQLGVPLTELAPTAAKAVVDERPAGAESLRMLLSANFALRAALGDPVLPDMDLLRDDVDTAWSLAHDSSYEQLAKLLQTLIPRLESAARAGNSDALTLLVRTYHVCAAALSKLGQFDAAWVAADRAISDAGRSRDPLLVAEGAFRLTLVFQGAGQFDQARQAAQTAKTALESLVEQGLPEALSLYGALSLQLAVVAARTDRAGDARQYLADARQVAQRLGEDRNDYHTEFGPTNVKIHEVAVAVALGDAGEALRIASGTDSSHLSVERRARLLIDVARAWTQRRNPERALDALEEAERISPEQVRPHRGVHIVVRDLLQMQPDGTPLRAFAERVGVDVHR